MKNQVLRLAFLVVCFCMFPVVGNAECSATEKVQLNTQASYISYDYTYNDNGTFNISFENMTSSISLEYDDKIYKATKNGTTIKNVEEGKVMNIKVIASVNTNCYEDTLRTIQYRVPYYNHYLTSPECQNYPEVEICQTKFLSYQMTESLFKSMFETQKKEFIEEEDPGVMVEDTWLDILIDYLWKYGMQAGLFIIGTVCMFIIGHSAVKRAKAKF